MPDEVEDPAVPMPKVLCGLGGIVFAFYNEKKVLGVLET